MVRLGPLLLVLFLLAGGFGLTAAAQPVQREVLKELRIATSDSCDEIAVVELQFPFTVEGYAPPNEGSSLLVRIIPLRVGEITAPALRGREALVPPRDDETALEEVTFEGDGTDGPRLTFRFSRRVSYDLKSRSDSRSLMLHLHPDKTDAVSCDGESVPRGPAK